MASRCHFFVAGNWHNRCGIQRAPGGNPETLGRTAAYRQMAPESPRAHPIVGTASIRDVAMDEHGQTSPEAPELAKKRFDTTAANSASPEECQVFRLPTAGPANRVQLEQDGTGHLSLYFRGLRYGVDDYLPNSLFGWRPISPSITAGEFVCRQMLRDYGYDEAEWPTLARLFLMTHTICQPDRSQHKR